MKDTDFLSQDLSYPLFAWFASKPDARRLVRNHCKEIEMNFSPATTPFVNTFQQPAIKESAMAETVITVDTSAMPEATAPSATTPKEIQMTTPTPSATTLAIATIIEGTLAPIFAILAAPLAARLEKLEKDVSETYVDPERFAEKLGDTDAFADAVKSVIDDNSNIIFSNIESDIDTLVEKAIKDIDVGDDVEDKVTDAIESALDKGSFEITFSR